MVTITEAESVHCSDRVWPAAEDLLRFMRAQGLSDSAILELGAGTGAQENLPLGHRDGSSKKRL
jgi:hypothetical protein